MSPLTKPKEYSQDLKQDIIISAISAFSNIRFNNSNDVHSFIYQYTGFDNFFIWFNQKIATKDYFGAYQFFGEEKIVNEKIVPKVRNSKGPIAKADEVNFNAFWNRMMPLLPQEENDGINLIQFLGLFTIVINESSRFRPIGEYGDLAYIYKYNKHPNKTAGFLFSNSDFKNAHSNLDYYNDVTADSESDVDKVWSGVIYPKKTDANPDGFPIKPSEAGIIAEADFYKFRGRAFIQTTWRPAYIKIIEKILDYNGENKTIIKYKNEWKDKYASNTDTIATYTTNAIWDELFEKTDLEIAGMAIKNFKKSEYFMKVNMKNSLDLLGEKHNSSKGDNSIKSIAKLVAGKTDEIYHQVFECRIIQILEQLLIDNVTLLNSNI